MFLLLTANQKCSSHKLRAADVLSLSGSPASHPVPVNPRIVYEASQKSGNRKDPRPIPLKSAALSNAPLYSMTTDWTWTRLVFRFVIYLTGLAFVFILSANAICSYKSFSISIIVMFNWKNKRFGITNLVFD